MVIGTDCTVLNNPKFNIKSPTKTIENLPLQYKSIFESGSTDLEKAVIFYFVPMVTIEYQSYCKYYSSIHLYAEKI